MMMRSALCVLGTAVLLSACDVTDDEPAIVDTTLPKSSKRQETAATSVPGTASALGDLAGALSFSSIRQCEFDPATAREMARMLEWDWESLTAKSADNVTLAGKALRVSRADSVDPDYPGSRIVTASVQFDEHTRWNGLSLNRMIVETGYYPESDGYNARKLTFRNSPQEVQTAMEMLGASIPLSPDFAEIADDGCGGAMQIEVIDGGAAFSCGFGC